MYETHQMKILTRAQFVRRVLGHLAAAMAAIAVALFIGVSGYHFLGRLPWVDALLNASMILGGMGQVDPLHTNAAKIFASAYALFSGLFFIAILAVILAPFAHRLMHRLHIKDDVSSSKYGRRASRVRSPATVEDHARRARRFPHLLRVRRFELADDSFAILRDIAAHPACAVRFQRRRNGIRLARGRRPDAARSAVAIW